MIQVIPPMRLPALLVLFVLLLLVGCSDADRADAANDVLNVVATTSMIADLAREIGGEHVAVTGLMGPGVDPHLYQTSAGDVTRMSRAEVILYNGLHLEGKMTDVFAQMKRRQIPTVALAEEALTEEDLIVSPAFAGNYDPHVWFDVGLWRRVGAHLADVFSEMVPEHADAFRAHLDEYSLQLDTLDAYVRSRLAEIPEDKRVLITSHDAFGYFGQAYGFEVYGLQGISTATEAGTADVQQLAAFVAERRIPAMFIETSVSARGIQAVREAVRSRGFDVQIGGTLYGDALGPPNSPAGSYIGTIRANVDTIVEALTAGDD